MAKSTGKFGAYSSLRPLQGDLSNDIQDREELDFKYREEKRLIEEADALKREKEYEKAQKSGDEFSKSLEKTRISAIGKTNHDHPIMEITHEQGGIMDMLVNVHERLKKDGMDYEARIIQDNLYKNIADFNAQRTGFAQAYQMVEKGLADKSLSVANVEYLKNMKSMIENVSYKLKLNPDGTFKTINLGKTDFNGDGIPELPDEFTPKDIYSLKIFDGLIPTWNGEKWMTDNKARFAPTELGYTKGVSQVTKERFDPSLETVVDGKTEKTAFGLELDKLFGEMVDKKTKQAVSFIADSLQLDPTKFDEAAFKNMKGEFAKLFAAQYKKKDDSKVDSGLVRTYNDIAKDNAAANKDKPSSISLMTNTNGKPLKVKSNGKEYTQFNVDPVKIKMDKDDVTVDRLWLGTDGEIRFKGTKTIPAHKIVKGKDSSGKVVYEEVPEKRVTVTNGSLHDTGLGMIANKLIGGNASDLKTLLQEQAGIISDEKKQDLLSKYGY